MKFTYLGVTLACLGSLSTASAAMQMLDLDQKAKNEISANAKAFTGSSCNAKTVLAGLSENSNVRLLNKQDLTEFLDVVFRSQYEKMPNVSYQSEADNSGVIRSVITNKATGLKVFAMAYLADNGMYLYMCQLR